VTLQPNIFALPSDAKGTFWLFIVSVVLTLGTPSHLLTAPSLPILAATFVAIFVGLQFGYAGKYRRSHDAYNDDRRAVLGLSGPNGVSLRGVFFVGAIDDTRALTYRSLRGFHIVLGRGLILVRRRSTGSFTAIVLHEIGHILNGDVAITQIARASMLATWITYGIVMWLSVSNFDARVLAAWRG